MNLGSEIERKRNASDEAAIRLAAESANKPSKVAAIEPGPEVGSPCAHHVATPEPVCDGVVSRSPDSDMGSDRGEDDNFDEGWDDANYAWMDSDQMGSCILFSFGEIDCGADVNRDPMVSKCKYKVDPGHKRMVPLASVTERCELPRHEVSSKQYYNQS